MTATDLRCEYLVSPLGIDVAKPRLSWRIEASDSDRHGVKQTAYDVLVASSERELNANRGDLWDSDEVVSDQSALLEYAGTALVSDQQCWWKVRVKDDRGVWTDWSRPAHWTMGILDTEDWKARWIGAPKDISANECPWLRKEIDLPAKPGRAVIHVASIGYHELYVNGKKVGNAVLEPAVADYRKRARYRTYEIGPLLRRGKNVIGIWLGTGWSIYSEYNTKDRPSRPLALAQAFIQLEGKEPVELVTDDTWTFHSSPIKLLGDWGGSSFGGDLYDANLDDPSWCAEATRTPGWKPVELYDLSRTLSAEYLEPDQVMHVLKPMGMQKQPDGAYRLDMGHNYAGWVEIPMKGNPGDHVKVEFSERKDKEETYGLASEYMIGPSGSGVFCNKFNYGSGRWITVRGLQNPPPLGEVKGFQIHSSYERSADFECSNDLLNWIYNTTLWTFENLSIGGYVVDCPQRERRGYGGDAHATTQTALDNFGMGAFYTKWSQDWRDVQSEDGNLPYTAPTYSGGGGPPWSGFCIHLPWKMYEHYGDTRILRENFPTMQSWLAFMDTHMKDGLLQRFGGEWDFLGDWLWPYDERSGIPNGDLPETLFLNNCYLAYALETASKIASILGETTAADLYRDKAAKLCTAIHARYYRSQTHDYANGHQNYLAGALIANVPPPTERPAVWKRLDEEVLVHRQGHIDAGITGGALLTRLLIDSNRADLMYTMATKEDYPSWGYFRKVGQTTIPESWDNTESQLHSSYLYVGAWFIEGLAGIRPGPDGGYKSFVLRPLVDTNPALEHVAAHYDSLYGRISISWTLKGGNLAMEVMVPPNSEGTLYLPAAYSKLLERTGNVRVQGGVAQVRLEPGRYTFGSAG